MADPRLDALKDAATARGYRLIRSRVRTKGKGDFGKVGLKDASGKEVLGFKGKELTAAPEDIEAFLRGDNYSDWAASARSGKGWKKPTRTNSTKPANIAIKPKPAPKRRLPPKITPAVDEKPPELVIRSASAKDATALSKLVGTFKGPPSSKTLNQFLGKSPPDAAVAEQDGLIGMACWTAYDTVSVGRIGHVALVYVTEERRREGIGSKLLDHARKALAAEGCSEIEIVSDPASSGSISFIRQVGFDRKSYRFAQTVPDQ